MIHPPRRAVTRFFIPLIDVLILLFCIFLLMPFVEKEAGSGKLTPGEAEALRRQIEQLARVVDDLDIDVTAVGILTDFQTRLFPGSQRLVELADRVEVLQVEALCWCGARATHNARTVGGEMVVEGAQVVVGDVNQAEDQIGYEVLCRRHHRRRMTSARP